MKKKSDLITVQIKNHRDSKDGHPHVIVDDIEDKHVSVGITHDKKKGNNSPNYKLERNPLGGKEQSYMRRQGTVAPRSTYDKPRKGRMTPKDFATAQRYGAKAKQKYLDRKKGKKK